MNAFFIAFWKGEERKIKSRENDMKIRRDFCIVFCICSRKECDNVQESDLQRASKILRTAFGSDWKQIVQTLGTRELTHCVLLLWHFRNGQKEAAISGEEIVPRRL